MERTAAVTRPRTDEPEEVLARLEREKHELQQALAILAGAAARTVAQSNPHDRGTGNLKELGEAATAARDVLDRTR